MQPQQGAALHPADDSVSSRRRSSSSQKASSTASSATAILGTPSSPVSSRSSTISSRARTQPSTSSLAGLFRSGLNLAARPNQSDTAASSTTVARGLHRRWTTDAEGSSPVKKGSVKASDSLARMRHTADQPSSTKTGGPATRRTISLEARAAPVNAAQAAPKCPGSTGRNVAARSSSNGAHGSASQAAAPSSTGDVLQSAEDDLDMEDTVRVKSHAQASTRGSPDMVTKWDTQVAMKPPAFDQDDHVQSQDQFLDIAVVSRGGRLNSGWKKENQDKFLLQLNREDGWSVMGVFDGHGNWGGRVATSVRDSMLTAMKNIDGRKMSGSDPEMALKNAFDFADSELGSTAMDLSRSGTTAVVSIVTSKWIATAWAGDSRMVLGRQVQNEDGQGFMEAVELTEDHKPDNPIECRRIREAGGRVDRLVSERTQEPVGPFRVYLQYSWSPGLACSRAFGDKMAVEVGVTHKPDVTIHTLTPEDRYLIVASDGVWELISSQEAIEIVAQYPDDVEQGCARLLQVSRERWAGIQGGRTCDDITAVVTKLNVEKVHPKTATTDSTAANAVRH
ncbi:hypothetical protein ABBQ38_008813 [Trebouxia sp. C0009 RCD-2024]